MLCKIAYCKLGPTISTLAKANNMFIVGTKMREIKSKGANAADDKTNADQWTSSQYEKFLAIFATNENHLKQNMPPNMYEMKQKFMQKLYHDKFLRQMTLLNNAELFIEADVDKDGRLNFQEYQNFINLRNQQQEKELGSKQVSFTND